MEIFVDTSALIALIVANDRAHPSAAAQWVHLQHSGAVLISTNYVLLEAASLLQRRIGVPAVISLQSDYVPLLTVHWVDEPQHRAAMSALLVANRRDLSLVDCVSFEVMRDHGIRQAFTFDSDFTGAGFDVIP